MVVVLVSGRQHAGGGHQGLGKEEGVGEDMSDLRTRLEKAIEKFSCGVDVRYWAEPIALLRDALVALGPSSRAWQPPRSCPLCSRHHDADCDLAFSTCTCKADPCDGDTETGDTP